MLLAMEEAAGGISTVLPPLKDIFWSALIVLVILLVLDRYALPRIYAMLDERTAKIQKGIEDADKAKSDLAAAGRERDDILRAANQEAHGIREKANEDAQRIIAQARSEAQGEATRITETAQRQIEADKQAAQISLRSDVGLLATELAEKIVGEQLKDTELTARVVDRFLDDLEKESSAEVAH